MSWWAPLTSVPLAAMFNTTRPKGFLCGDLIKHKSVLGICKHKTGRMVSKLDTGRQGLRVRKQSRTYLKALIVSVDIVL